MFETLSEKLQAVFGRMSNRGRLTEKDVDEALRQVRLALLEADVNFRVVRDFIDRIRQRAVGEEVLQSLSPGQQVVKIVHEELVRLLGETQSHLQHARQAPTVYLLAGLQGSGKTTTAAKLALQERRSGQRPVLVAADVYRPAAIDQLVTLGKQLNVPVYTEAGSKDPVGIVRGALTDARTTGATIVIVDTAGRLHVDTEMMQELVNLKAASQPSETLLVVDAMTGQDALRVAEEFHRSVELTGLILTKVDGDARGGAALSIRAVTGLPVKFIGTGEKADALEPFHPDRLASRILGMGDVLTLIERAQENFDQQHAQELERKMRTGSLDLEDFLEQLRQMQKLGPLEQILEMIPGMSGLGRKLPKEALDPKQIKHMEAIVLSMTPVERHQPETIDGSRRRRIARGSGTSVQEVNQLLNQFKQMQQLTKAMSRGRGMGLLPRKMKW